MRHPGAVPERSPIVPLRALHASLHGGRAGAIIVGALGLVLTAQGISGLWLYGPGLIRRSRPRTLHRVLGGPSLVFAAVAGSSGLLLALFSALGIADVAMTALVRHVHYGDFAGWTSRVLYAVAGLALPILAITGYWIVARRPD
jgi:uncharacterized iron-regulated membrane protein